MRDTVEHVLVRYADIGTKSRHVRQKMQDVLRQRVQDRLRHEDIEHQKVASNPGRIVVETGKPEVTAETVSELPGVASASPAVKTEPEIDAMKSASERFEYGETFGVDASRTGQHTFSSREVKKELGSHIEDFSGAGVDLDNPDTLLEADIRPEKAYVFAERYEGPGGLPAGTQGSLTALVSGGIDSPVASYHVMKRGSDITPVYFYNRPIAAEDHLMRFQASIEKLRKFHPGKKWEYYVVDMKEVNEALMDVEKGRMVLHRLLMFKVAERIAEREGLKGIVTGESLGQKSSQTASNLEVTASEVEKPIFRPLIGRNKNEIVRTAKEIDTFEEAKIDSACRTMAPEEPSTCLKKEELESLKQEVDLDGLVEKAFENREKHVLGDRKD